MKLRYQSLAGDSGTALSHNAAEHNMMLFQPLALCGASNPCRHFAQLPPSPSFQGPGSAKLDFPCSHAETVRRRLQNGPHVEDLEGDSRNLNLGPEASFVFHLPPFIFCASLY